MALITQRIDVPVIVDESKCLEKCTACIEVCPLDVLAKNPETGKAYMKYDECWFCLRYRFHFYCGRQERR
jgi:Fe-S-cluster-containing hydrogenase component 2